MNIDKYFKEPPPPPLPFGTNISKYEIKSVLGSGSFGITYLAQHVDLDYYVAIKEFFSRDFSIREKSQFVTPRPEYKTEYREFIRRFLEEGKTIAKYKHHGIIRVIDYIKENGTAYIVMEYEVGCTLKQYIERKGEAFKEKEILKFLHPILDALEIIHEDKIIHRDIKPDNIYIRKDDGSTILLDFGSSRQYFGEKTGDLTRFFSDGYSPIEQYNTNRESQGPWSDIYSLGAVLYLIINYYMENTCGKLKSFREKRPCDATTRSSKMLEKGVDPLESAVKIGINRYSVSFLQAIDWALCISKNDRPQSIKEWRKKFQVSQKHTDARVKLHKLINAPKDIYLAKKLVPFIFIDQSLVDEVLRKSYIYSVRSRCAFLNTESTCNFVLYLLSGKIHIIRNRYSGCFMVGGENQAYEALNSPNWIPVRAVTNSDSTVLYVNEKNLNYAILKEYLNIKSRNWSGYVNKFTHIEESMFNIIKDVDNIPYVVIKKIWFMLENILNRLCRESSIEIIIENPTIKNMIDFLIENNVIPNNMLTCANFLRNFSNPEYYFQLAHVEVPHAQLALLGLVNFLDWCPEIKDTQVINLDKIKKVIGNRKNEEVGKSASNSNSEIQLLKNRITLSLYVVKLYSEGEEFFREIEFKHDEIIIGRSKTCAVSLPDPRISTLHAKISLKNKKLEVKDLCSRNGIIINGRQIERGEVCHIRINDDIVIFPFSMRIRYSDKSENSCLPIDIQDGSVPKLVTVGGHDEKTYKILHTTTTIGSSILSDVCLAGLFVPRVAATILKKQDGYYIDPIKRVQVNNEKIIFITRISDGDLIQVYNLEMVFYS